MLAAGGDVRELCRVLHLSAGHGQGDHRLLPVKTEIEDAPGFAEPKVEIDEMKLLTASYSDDEAPDYQENHVYSDHYSSGDGSDEEFLPKGVIKKPRGSYKVNSTPPGEEVLDEIRLKREEERDRKRRQRLRKNGDTKELTLELEKLEEKREKRRLKREEKLSKKRKRAAFKPCPDVWLKEPSPDRFRDGVKTEEFYMSEETAAAGPPYKCLMCEYKTPFKRYLKKHFQSRHSKEKLYRCKVCGVAKIAKENVVCHWQRIHNPNRQEDLTHVCDTCGKMYGTDAELRNHKIVHENLQLPCRYCGKNFKTPSQLSGHEKRHETDRAPCKVCGKLYNSAKEAQDHEFLVHYDTSTEDCKLCGKTLKPSSMKSHMERMHGDKEKKFNCHICGNSFALSSSLQKHIAIVHDKSKQFQCPFCEVVLSNKSKFGRHSSRRHGGAAIPQAVKDLLRPLCYMRKVNEPELKYLELIDRDVDT